jgi:hypothetical protein
VANLGTLSTRNISQTPYIYRLPVWLATNAVRSGTVNRSVTPYKRYFAYPLGASFTAEVVDGSMSGTVTENGLPVANAVVMAFERFNGLCVARVYSKADGTFVLPTVFTKSDRHYFVVAFDPEGGVSYNALVYDKIQAV